MRLLVACAACRRQFDATGQPVGSRFHCLCGEAVEVQPAKGHDASVVRCSSCGAPRAAGEIACRHCDADFTLHEQDRDTVCPACFARVSDRARFCHHCGMPLAVEQVAGESTQHDCPVCGPGRNLRSRRLGGEQVAVLECNVCGGLWLGHDAVETLTRQAARETAGGVRTPVVERRPPQQLQSPGGAKSPARTEAPRPARYRKCVVCGGLMPQRNYGGKRKSGVIIDLCRDHGVWFDAEELRAVLAWIRQGGAAEPVAETRTALGDPQGPIYSEAAPLGFPPTSRSPFGDLAEAVLFGLGSLFRFRP